MVLGVGLTDGIESLWRVGLTDGIKSPTVILGVLSESIRVWHPKDGEPCLTRTHFRGGSLRYRRANRSLHSAQQLVPSEVSHRIAEFQQCSSGTAND